MIGADLRCVVFANTFKSFLFYNFVRKFTVVIPLSCDFYCCWNFGYKNRICECWFKKNELYLNFNFSIILIGQKKNNHHVKQYYFDCLFRFIEMMRNNACCGTESIDERKTSMNYKIEFRWGLLTKAIFFLDQSNCTQFCSSILTVSIIWSLA